jgi:hypothetical protein
MSTLSNVLDLLWSNRDNLKATPKLLSNLYQIRENHLPYSGQARKLEIYLTKPKPKRVSPPTDISSIEAIVLDGKRVILIGLQKESHGSYEFIKEQIQASMLPLDLFIHYPYTKDAEARSLVSDSYAAKRVFKLDNPHRLSLFGDQVRFHYCDLRLEWLGKDKDSLYQRLKLLADYSEYLLHQDEPDAENEFGERLKENSIDLKDLLLLEKSLMSSTGKLQKSYDKVDSPLRDMVMQAYEQQSSMCEMRLTAIRDEILKHQVVPVYLYIEWMGELNCLYQHLNAAYTLLRILRHFRQVANQYSADAENCVVVLPEPMIHILREMLPTVRRIKYNLYTLEQWFQQD